MFLALIGYRGSGKTKVAEGVARGLGWNWVDADAEIELHAGKSIAAIFADDGEAVFRDLETKELRELVGLDRTVISLGGGVVLREENRALLKQAREAGQGKVVWLKGSPEVLQRRIEGDPATAARRPKLTSEGGVAEVRKLLGQREPYYRECADKEVETEGKSLEEVAKEVVKWVEA